MNVVFTRLRVSVADFAAFRRNTVTEIPVVGENRIAVSGMRCKPKSCTRVSGGRVLCSYNRRSRSHVGIDYLQYADGMRGLPKNEHVSGRRRNLFVVQDIGNHILAGRSKPCAAEIDGTISILVGPVENGQDALPAIFFKEEHTRLLILGCELHEIDWDRRLPEPNHLDQILILNQSKALGIIRQRRKIVSNL